MTEELIEWQRHQIARLERELADTKAELLQYQAKELNIGWERVSVGLRKVSE